MRFSRELHDRLAHQMTVVTQSLDLFESLRESNPGRAEERLALAREMADVEGVGIDSMAERAERLGGVFELSPDPDGGARVEVRLPLMREENP